MTKKKVSVAAVSMIVEHNKERNLRRYMQFIGAAARRDIDLIVFPECSLQGYTWTWDFEKRIYRKDKKQQEYFLLNSETIPGPSTSLIIDLAKENSMYIIAGMAEKSKGRIYNSAVLAGPRGILGVHRKVHMASSPIFSRGHQFSVYPTRIGKVGMVICADLKHPDSAKSLALQGAQIIVNSSAWSMCDTKANPKTDPGGHAYDLVTRAASYFNRIWLLSANQFGSSKKSSEIGYGHSRIVDPEGRVIKDSGYREGMVIAEINLSTYKT